MRHDIGKELAVFSEISQTRRPVYFNYKKDLKSGKAIFMGVFLRVYSD
jgi:hypothetical protein